MKKYILYLIASISFIQMNAQNSCDLLLTECETEFLDFAQSVLEDSECKQWEERCDLDSYIYRTGKVSIGTNEFVENFKLVVTDGIIARKLIVCEDSDNWCDYVFEESYELISLEDVACFIEENGHLPKTPSGKQIEEEGGFIIGNTTLNHQEKIEEIFLHLITMKKEANTLQAKLKRLKAENRQLKENSYSNG